MALDADMQGVKPPLHSLTHPPLRSGPFNNEGCVSLFQVHKGIIALEVDSPGILMLPTTTANIFFLLFTCVCRGVCVCVRACGCVCVCVGGEGVEGVCVWVGGGGYQTGGVLPLPSCVSTPRGLYPNSLSALCAPSHRAISFLEELKPVVTGVDLLARASDGNISRVVTTLITSHGHCTCSQPSRPG